MYLIYHVIYRWVFIGVTGLFYDAYNAIVWIRGS